jgi:hypothetical protein
LLQDACSVDSDAQTMLQLRYAEIALAHVRLAAIAPDRTRELLAHRFGCHVVVRSIVSGY